MKLTASNINHLKVRNNTHTCISWASIILFIAILKSKGCQVQSEILKRRRSVVLFVLVVVTYGNSSSHVLSFILHHRSRGRPCDTDKLKSRWFDDLLSTDTQVLRQGGPGEYELYEIMALIFVIMILLSEILALFEWNIYSIPLTTVSYVDFLCSLFWSNQLWCPMAMIGIFHLYTFLHSQNHLQRAWHPFIRGRSIQLVGFNALSWWLSMYYMYS